MKKLALTLTILSTFCALAYAGPEPYSGKEMKQVAPMPPPCPNWTGFYIGGFGAYQFASADPNLDLFGSWDGPNSGGSSFRDPFDRDVLDPLGSKDLNTSGFEAGGLIGYNYQLNNKWVFGFEAAAGYTWLDETNDTGPIAPAGSISTYSDIHTSFRTNYLITAGPRIGYAFCKWLPYVTGGVAVSDVHFSQEIVESDIVFNEGGSKNDTKVGWMVGGGLQYSVADHWSVRAQYQYVDLGSLGFNSAGDADPTYLGKHDLSLREHNASFAIIYGF
jgi:outer membrane immunogenic protein